MNVNKDKFTKCVKFETALNRLSKMVQANDGDIFFMSDVLYGYKQGLKEFEILENKKNIFGEKLYDSHDLIKESMKTSKDADFESATHIYPGHYYDYWKMGDGCFCRVNVEYHDGIGWYIDCGCCDEPKEDIANKPSPKKLQMAVDDCTLQGEDPNIYGTISKFFPNIEDEEVEAVYNYIADYTVSSETQSTDEQIDLLYAKGYLVNEADSTCTASECENSLEEATWHGISCKENGCTDYIIGTCMLAETCNKCFDETMEKYPGLTCKAVYDLDNPDISDGDAL